MKDKFKVKLAVSFLAAIFLVLLYIMIFFFSGQDGETSGSLSHRVTEEIVVRVGEITRKHWTDEIKASLISFWENPVRKMAHFSEYTAMGILVFLFWLPWVSAQRWLHKGWRWSGLVLVWVFLSAAADEWHQTFVSARSGNFWDVLLDTSGGCFGLLLSLGMTALILHIQKRKKPFVHQALLWAVLLTAGFQLVLFLCFTPHYALNDDMMIESILSGTYLRNYPYSYYFSAELGWIFAGLYRILPYAPWLGLFYLLCNGVCLLTAEWMILSKTAEKSLGKYVGAFLVLLGFTALCLPNLVMVHYTCLAAMLGAVGLCLLLLEGGKRERVVAISFFLLSYLVRENIFFLLCPLIALSFLYLFWNKKDSGERRKLLYDFGLFCILFLLFFLMNRGVLQSKEWKEYLSYNQVRTDVYDYYGVATEAPALQYYESKDLTEQELILLTSYDIALLHDGGGNEDDLRTVAEYGGLKKASESRGVWVQIKQYLYRFLRQREDAPWNYFVICLYVFDLFLILWRRKGVQDFLLLVMTGCYRSLVWMYLLHKGRYPERVTLSLYWMEIAFLIGFTMRLLQKKSEKPFRIALILLMGGFFAVTSLTSIQKTRQVYEENRRQNREDAVLMDYMEQHRDRFYLLDVYTTVYRTKPVLTFQERKKENYLWLGGWMVRHPLYLDKLRGQMPEADNAWDLLTGKENCYLVLKENAGISKEDLEKALSVSLEETERLSGEQSLFLIYHVKEQY